MGPTGSAAAGQAAVGWPTALHQEGLLLKEGPLPSSPKSRAGGSTRDMVGK